MSYSWSRSSTLTVSGAAEPGSTVEVFDGSTSYGSTTATTAGTWSRQVTGLSDGAYLFTARARNLGGVSGNSGATVVQVDTRAPAAPGFTSPAANSAVGTAFTLTGTAEAGTTVELFEDGVSRGTLAASNGTWSKQLSGVTAGTRTYTAKTTDFAGNTSPPSSGYSLRVG